MSSRIPGRKEEELVQIRKMNAWAHTLCLPRWRPRIHSLRSRRNLHKFRVAGSCRAPEKRQSPYDGHKDGADYSYRGKENGHASEECALSRDRASRSSPGPIPSSCPGVKKTQTHSCVQSKHSQVTGKDERMLKALRPDDTPPSSFYLGLCHASMLQSAL